MNSAQDFNWLFQVRHFGIRPFRGHGTFLFDGCLPHPLRPLNHLAQIPDAGFMLENNPLFIISLSEPNVLIG